MSLKISYIFPSRSRPDKFFAALMNIRNKSASSNYEVIAKLDIDDEAMNNDEVKERLSYHPEVIVKWGLSENKIHAVNRDNDFTGEILCCHSDDMVFTKQGFDDIIRREIKKDGYLHFPDGYANEKLCTYSIMHADYYNRFGYIYHPAYKSLWADNEQMTVAKRMYKYKYVDENILEHMHPSAGKADKDAQYQVTEKFNSVDKATFLKRKKNNFDLPQKTLSVLICSLYERKDYLFRLIDVLRPQLNEEIEVKICIDSREATTGDKRNDLLEAAMGKYVVFIDDDDLVSSDYINSILAAAKDDPDAIVFKGWMTTNGANKKHFELSKDFDYVHKNNKYYRYPNHIVPIRSTIAKRFKFPGKVWGEDYAWATDIHNSGLIKTETAIDKDLYFYLYNSK